MFWDTVYWLVYLHSVDNIVGWKNPGWFTLDNAGWWGWNDSDMFVETHLHHVAWHMVYKKWSTFTNLVIENCWKVVVAYQHCFQHGLWSIRVCLNITRNCPQD